MRRRDKFENAVRDAVRLGRLLSSDFDEVCTLVEQATPEGRARAAGTVLDVFNAGGDLADAVDLAAERLREHAIRVETEAAEPAPKPREGCIDVEYVEVE